MLINPIPAAQQSSAVAGDSIGVPSTNVPSTLMNGTVCIVHVSMPFHWNLSSVMIEILSGMRGATTGSSSGSSTDTGSSSGSSTGSSSGSSTGSSSGSSTRLSSGSSTGSS